MKQWRILRVLWRRPGFTLAVVLTLALGIGANTTIFSVVNGVLLRPLPYHEPDRLLRIQSHQIRAGGRPIGNSLADYLDWRAQSRTFEHLALYTTLDFNLPGDGTEPLPIRVNFATSELFALLGVPPHVGRAFIHPEERPGGDLYSVILSHDLWRRRFGFWPGADPLGQRVKPGASGSKEEWHTVVGVVGNIKYSGLHVDSELAVYYPYTQRTAGDLHVLIRTRGAPLQWVDAVQRAVWAVDPDLAIYSLRTMSSILANSIWQQRLWGAVFSVFAIVAVVLALIGISGVLAWSVRQRYRELGVRIALGAQRRDVIALILGQGMRLVCVGLAAGLVAAVVLTRSLSALLFGVAATDPLTWVGVLVLLLVACAVACYLPARRAAKVDPIAVLKQA